MPEGVRVFFIAKYTKGSPEQNRLDQMVSALEAAFREEGLEDQFAFHYSAGGQDADMATKWREDGDVRFSDLKSLSDRVRFHGDGIIVPVPVSLAQDSLVPVEEYDLHGLIGSLGPERAEELCKFSFVIDITSEVEPEAWAAEVVRDAVAAFEPDPEPSM